MTDYPKYDLRVDGGWGSWTIYAIQYDCRRLGFYSSSYALDGVEGIQTRKAMQRLIKSKGLYSGAIDGLFQTQTVTGLKSFVNLYGNSYIITWGNYFPQSSIVSGLQRYLNNRN